MDLKTFSKISPTYPWKMGPLTLHQQFLFRNFFVVGLGKFGVPGAKSLTFSTMETKETLSLMGICKATLAVDGLEIRLTS